MTRTTTLLARTVSLGFFCGVMAAQTSTIQLDAVARDAAGHPVTGLTQPAFQVFDNGTPAAIKSITEVGKDASPASVMIVFDSVNTGTVYAARQRDQLASYLRQNNGKLANPTELTVVARNGLSITPRATTDGNALADIVSKIDVSPVAALRTAGEDSRRYGISLRAFEQVLGSTSQMPGRRLVLWLAPGWPLDAGSYSHPQSDQEDSLMKAAMNYSTTMRQNRITLYSLNTAADTSPEVFHAYQRYLKPVSEPKQAYFANLSLQVLATQSGGLVLKDNDLGRMLTTAMQDAGNHYEIVLDQVASNKSEPFHTLEVRAVEPGVTVRTRNGYYVQ